MMSCPQRPLCGLCTSSRHKVNIMLKFRYLSGVPHPAMLGGWRYGGMMFTPEMGNKLDLASVPWGADNGCFTAGARLSATPCLAFLAAYGRLFAKFHLPSWPYDTFDD